MNCEKCGVELEDNAKVCPKCDTPIPYKENITDAPLAKSIGAALAFGNGLLGSFIVIVVGIYLGMEGYHFEHFIAVLAIIVPSVAAYWGMVTFRQGKCPYCGKITNGNPRNNTILKCKLNLCKQKILYKDGKFHTIPDKP